MSDKEEITKDEFERIILFSRRWIFWRTRLVQKSKRGRYAGVIKISKKFFKSTR